MKRVAMGLAVAAVAACLVGCGLGGGGYSSPKATMETMRAAAKAGDEKGVMACYCKDSREKMEKMKEMFGEMAKDNDFAKKMMEKHKDAKVEYGEETITGDTATLEITMDGMKSATQFVREGGGWKIKLPITDEELEQMKKAAEMMKKMPKGMMKGLQKMGEETMKKKE